MCTHIHSVVRPGYFQSGLTTKWKTQGIAYINRIKKGWEEENKERINW